MLLFEAKWRKKMMNFSVQNANAHVIYRKDALRTHRVSVQKKTNKPQNKRSRK